MQKNVEKYLQLLSIKHIIPIRSKLINRKAEFMVENGCWNLTNPQMSIWNTEKYFEGTAINNICTARDNK